MDIIKIECVCDECNETFTKRVPAEQIHLAYVEDVDYCNDCDGTSHNEWLRECGVNI